MAAQHLLLLLLPLLLVLAVLPQRPQAWSHLPMAPPLAGCWPPGQHQRLWLLGAELPLSVLLAQECCLWQPPELLQAPLALAFLLVLHGACWHLPHLLPA